MKRLLIVTLLVVLAACTSAVVDEFIVEPPVVPPVVVEEPVVVEPPVENDLEEEVIEEEVIEEPTFELPEGATVIIKRMDVSQAELTRLFGDEDVYLIDEYDRELMTSAHHIIVIYDEWLISELPPIAFGVAQLRPMDVSVRTSNDKRFTLIYPGVTQYTDEFLSLLSSTDVTEVGDRFFAHQPIIDELYPQMTPYGNVGVLTSIVSAGSSAPFLPRGTHQTYTSPSSFFAADLDTRVIVYPVEGDLGVPPSRFGKRLDPGDIESFIDIDGVRTILIRERFRERMEWFFLNSEVLGLNGKYTVQQVNELFQYRGRLYRGPLFEHPNQRFVPRDVPFTEALSLLSNHVAPIDACRIQQTNRIPSPFGHPDINNNFGFPMLYNVPPTGEVNIAIIAIEFPDVPGEEEYLPIYLSQVEIMQDWAQFVSDGAMSYNIQFPDRWIMAPREAKYYTRLGGTQMDLNRPEAIAGQPFEASVQQLLTASDPYVDWSIIDFVQFVFPIASSRYAVDLQGPAMNLRSERAGLVSFWAWGAAYEQFRPSNPNVEFQTLWDWVAHEVLHYQGVAGHGPLNGSVYSIMMNQHTQTKALLSWESFLMGHFDDRQIACIDPFEIDEPIHLQLESLDLTGGAPGIKSLMIPVGEFEIVVVEYRTEGPYSRLSPEFQGFTVYYIDVDGIRERCDWCDPLLMEQTNYYRYLRNSTEILVCDQGFSHGAVCGFPSVAQYPGYHLDFFGLRLEFFNDGILTLRRLY